MPGSAAPAPGPAEARSAAVVVGAVEDDGGGVVCPVAGEDESPRLVEPVESEDDVDEVESPEVPDKDGADGSAEPSWVCDIPGAVCGSTVCTWPFAKSCESTLAMS